MPKAIPVYQLRVSLVETEPEIWRRILVPADIKLPKLHLALQAVMGWRNCHLHVFRDGENDYSPMPEDIFLVEKNVRLSDLADKPGQVIEYEYDMGDSWLHLVEIEKVLEPESGKTYPFCLEGTNDCPPEDCGGPPGYEHLLEALSNPRHSEHQDLKQWMAEYEPEVFDLVAINRRLSGLTRKAPQKKTARKSAATKKKKPVRRGVWVLDPRKAKKKAQ